MSQKVRSYTGVACPHCLRSLAENLQRSGVTTCPTCSRSFEMTLFRPAQARSGVQQITGSLPAGAAALCGNHSRNLAEQTCSRCGIFICRLCVVEADDMILCPACYDRLSAEGALSSARMRFRDMGGLASLHAACGILLMFFSILFGPAAMYYSVKGFQQKKQFGEEDGRARLTIAFVLGLLELVGGIALILVLAGTLK